MKLLDRILRWLHLVRLGKHTSEICSQQDTDRYWQQRLREQETQYQKDLLLATDIVHKLGDLRYTQSEHKDMRVWMVTYSISEHDMRAFSQGDTDAIQRVSEWIGWQIGRDLAAGNHWRLKSSRTHGW